MLRLQAIQKNVGWVRVGICPTWLLLFHDLKHGPAAIGAAVGAYAVGQVFGVALGALDQAGFGQRVMRATAVAAALGMFALWQRWHSLYFSL